jgi:kumamolisin
MGYARRLVAIAAVLTTVGAVALQGGASVAAANANGATKALSRSAGAAITTPMQVRTGEAKLVGAASAAQHLRLTIGLQTPNPAAEDAFVASLKDKSSPDFRHFLTAAEWNARFAPSAKSEQAVVNWARAQGFTVTKRYANRLIVDVDGTVATAQKAFGVKINDYQLGANAFFSNDQSVSLPAQLSSTVESVAGLNSLQRLKPANDQFATQAAQHPAYVAGPVRQTGPSAQANGSKALLAKAMAASKARGKGAAGPNTTNGYYDPTDIYSDQAYSVDALNAQGHCCNPTHAAGVTPPATSIAIATAGAHSGTDFAGFHNQYPYLAYHYQEFFIDGTPTCCDGEGTLDFDWSTAMSNSFGAGADTAMIYMYDGANTNLGTFTDIWNQMLSDGHARTMSSSWGCAESYCYDAGTMNTDHAIFNSMVGQGWTLVTDSDDKGAFADCSHVSVEYPASDPDVMSAGGTDLQAAGGFSSETAWIGATGAGSCATNGGGGGGGCSVQWALPSYQSGRIQSLCTTRAEPDVSLNAGIGQNYYFNGALSPSGGTSIVTPELAGIWAQINAYLGSFPSSACSGGCTTVGQANPDVYNALAGGTHDPFYDITSGCTTNDIGAGYCGIVGYDRASGLGSANLFLLANQVLWFNVIEASGPTITMSGPPTSGWVSSGAISWSIVDNGTGPTGVQGYTAQFDSDPGNPTTEPHGGSGNYFWDGPAAKNSASGSTGLLTGCHTLYVRSWDNIGDTGLNSYGPVCFDPTAPTITKAPKASLVKNSSVASGDVPVKISWAGADATSGVKNYRLQESLDGGAYSNVGGVVTTASKELSLPAGHAYRFRVRATDNANNVSSYLPGATFHLTLFQEVHSSIAYTSGWSRIAQSGASGGFVKEATVAGKKATFTFSGIQVGFVTTTSSNNGAATIAIDGGSATTVNTHAGGAHGKVRFVKATGSGSHTLVLTVSGTAGHPKVDVDAFVVIS